ncbi:recombinase family protein [Brachybacterium tyrofermentans]|uniref:recombinase family protein n=1 Tax=Brachybacterium tyrofermentans TaxID=47848 RepID=UPI003FD412F5
MVQHSGQRVAYVRVSSLDQNPDRQLEAVGECNRIFLDREQGSHERLSSRTQLEELIQYVREGDHVVVASMDRLARSVIDLNAITQRIVAKGVSVDFLKERLTFRAGDGEDPFAQFQMNLMGSFAQFEREMIRHRQAEGIAAAKKRGVYKGRARMHNDEQVLQMRAQAAQGVPKARIAREWGISRSTLYRYLDDQPALPLT